VLCKSGRILLPRKRKEVNHAGTESTEAKQKEGSHFRKKSFAQRRGDAKKKKKEKFFKQIYRLGESFYLRGLWVSVVFLFGSGLFGLGVRKT